MEDSQTSCSFSDIEKKTPAKFQKQLKVEEELLLQDTQCLLGFARSFLKMTEFKLLKSDTINLRITVKHHLHLQTLTKTPAKFQKDPAKTVGVDAFTGHPVSICFSRS